MASALIQKGSFHMQQVVLVIMPLFLVWMQVVLFMLPIELTTFWYLEKVLHQSTIQQFMQKKCIELILAQLTKKRFSLSLHYNGNNSYLFVNGKEIIKFKARDSEIVEDPICLRNILKDFSEISMKKTGLYGSVYYFSIDHNATAANDILDTHNYLIKNYII